MKTTDFSFARRGASTWRSIQVVMGSLALGAVLTAPALAADMYRPAPTPGGIDSHPIITSTIVSGSNVILNFKGLEAPYQAQVAPMGTTNWSLGATTALKWPDFAGSVTVSNVTGSNSQFRMNMLGHAYVSYEACYGCHTETINSWLGTGHATSINALKDTNGAISQFFMDNCVVCHSVGYGQPGGFVSLTETPKLANVGCEACHGPAGAHVGISGRQYRPVPTIASEVCGGCHTDAHHPTYNEWTNSAHAAVTESVAEEIESANLDSGQGRQMSCGPCHSGATRLAMLGELTDRQYGYTNRLILPTAHDGASYGVTCAVCHDPHSTNIGPHQVRNPIFSTAFYTFFNGSDTRSTTNSDVFGVVTTNLYYMNTVFATQYVATIQICAQCHNSRGAVWTGTSRPPHHSPQYNLLIGGVQPGYLNGTDNFIGPHGLNTNGCTACHMAPTTVANPTDQNPNYTGHEFKVTMNGCAALECHESVEVAEALKTAIQLDTTSRIKGVVDLLNSWATNKAPTITNAFIPYGKYAWEFTSAGQLSNPTNNPATVGPPSALQSKVPDLIKKARFSLYLVEHDASKGVHNIDYSRFLLRDARTNVLNALK